jgi:hypothetical protein
MQGRIDEIVPACAPVGERMHRDPRFQRTQDDEQHRQLAHADQEHSVPVNASSTNSPRPRLNTIGWTRVSNNHPWTVANKSENA